MPCYTEWDAYLQKDSNGYRTAKAKLDGKLIAVKHIVDYYYGVAGLKVPPAKHSGQKTWMEMAHREFSCDESHTQGADDNLIMKQIAHHCSCDGIRFTILYDLVSLLDLTDPLEAGYARILMTCANEIRANKDEYASLPGRRR